MFEFGKSVLVGLWQAFKTDVNVFLIGCAGFTSIFKRGKGLASCILFYVGLRRIDDLMGVYLSSKVRDE